MNIAAALAVVNRLEDETVDEFVKIDAIFSVVQMGTLLSVSKKQLVGIVKWLLWRVHSKDMMLTAVTETTKHILRLRDEETSAERSEPDRNPTNYERVRPKNLEEMAELIFSKDDDLLDDICKKKGGCPFGKAVQPSDCKNCVIEWLKEEADSAVG